MRIDAHQHFWAIARGDYGWLTQEDFPALHRDFMPEDLAPLLRQARIDRTILVQAAETIAETEFLLDVAERTPFVDGVVGWINFEAPSAADAIARLAERGKLVGLRPMMQDMADKAWMLRADLRPAFAAMQRHGLAFDALIKPPHVPHLPAFLAKYPDLKVVIDHGAKPYIATGELEPWAAQMRTIARRPNLCCKLSGLATEAGDFWDAAKLRPYVEVLIECFTPRRLMWGSDWPVLTLAGDYPGWLAAAEELTADLSPGERENIFGDAAAAFYGVGDA